jgi:hypothetical protein
MSTDDFGTVNLRRGERAREIEVLRQHYRRHHDALQRMTEDAPTEHLANEYQRLIAELDRSLAKCDELEGLTPAAPTAPPSPEPTRPHGDPLGAQRPRSTDPGLRPLVTTPVPPPHPARAGLEDTIPPGEAEPRSRLPLIIGAALLALAVIGALIWRASSGRETAGAVVEERPVIATDGDAAGADTADAGTVVADDTIEPSAPPISRGLAVTPPAHDFGVVRKGTRATRRFELTNNTDEPVAIQVARSACRCLFYVHAPVIPPKAKEALTVTIDGARAKAGAISEAVRISAKADGSVATNINVTATVR